MSETLEQAAEKYFIKGNWWDDIDMQNLSNAIQFGSNWQKQRIVDLLKERIDIVENEYHHEAIAEESIKLYSKITELTELINIIEQL